MLMFSRIQSPNNWFNVFCNFQLMWAISFWIVLRDPERLALLLTKWDDAGLWWNWGTTAIHTLFLDFRRSLMELMQVALQKPSIGKGAVDFAISG